MSGKTCYRQDIEQTSQPFVIVVIICYRNIFQTNPILRSAPSLIVNLRASSFFLIASFPVEEDKHSGKEWKILIFDFASTISVFTSTSYLITKNH